MRILICGDRNYTNYQKILSVLKDLKEQYGLILVIEGGAKGADTLAREASKELDILYEEYPADWITHKKAAGPIRNQRMIDEGKPDLVVAFHGNISESKGTKDMINKAKKYKIRWLLYE